MHQCNKSRDLERAEEAAKSLTASGARPTPNHSGPKLQELTVSTETQSSCNIPSAALSSWLVQCASSFIWQTVGKEGRDRFLRLLKNALLGNCARAKLSGAER